MITYANWFLIPWVPRGLRGVEGGGRVCAGQAWGVEEAGLGLKMCYRHFPKVKKPHSHKNPDNQARTVNRKNETEFPSDI